MTIEFLVVLPVLVAALLAVAQFGFYFQRVQQLVLASRVGAEEASQTAALTGSGAVPANIADAIHHQLQSNNISRVSIFVEHNNSGSQFYRTDYIANTIPNPNPATLPASGLVRVTVYVPLTDLMPNALAFFGFNITGQYGVSRTTFAYEL